MFEQSLHYRRCMMETIQYSDHSGQSVALAWRLLNLSIRRDAVKYGYKSYLNEIRNVDEEDLSSCGAYGKYYYQVPKTKIDLEIGEISADYPDYTYNIDFRINGTLTIMFECIADWIKSSGYKYDWVLGDSLDKEWLKILDDSTVE